MQDTQGEQGATCVSEVTSAFESSVLRGGCGKRFSASSLPPSLPPEALSPSIHDTWSTQHPTASDGTTLSQPPSREIMPHDPLILPLPLSPFSSPRFLPRHPRYLLTQTHPVDLGLPPCRLLPPSFMRRLVQGGGKASHFIDYTPSAASFIFEIILREERRRWFIRGRIRCRVGNWKERIRLRAWDFYGRTRWVTNIIENFVLLWLSSSSFRFVRISKIFIYKIGIQLWWIYWVGN